jgi:hypothetical protein
MKTKKMKNKNKKVIRPSTFNLLRIPLRSILRTRLQSTSTLQEPSLATTSIEMIRNIPRILARSEHTASHFIAIGIHYLQTVSGVSHLSQPQSDCSMGTCAMDGFR